MIDSATRMQLSGFDARPSSLAFSADGVLAGGSWDGSIWIWRDGRCPEIGTAWPQALAMRKDSEPKGGRSGSPVRDGPGRRGAPPERRPPPPRPRFRPQRGTTDVRRV